MLQPQNTDEERNGKSKEEQEVRSSVSGVRLTFWSCFARDRNQKRMYVPVTTSARRSAPKGSARGDMLDTGAQKRVSGSRHRAPPCRPPCVIFWQRLPPINIPPLFALSIPLLLAIVHHYWMPTNGDHTFWEHRLELVPPRRIQAGGNCTKRKACLGLCFVHRRLRPCCRTFCRSTNGTARG